MIKDIYVKDGWYNNNILTLLRNDNKEIPIDLKHVERRFTWYYNDTEEPTVDPDDPTVDPGTDPIDPDPQNPGDDPITPNPQPETPNIYNVHVQLYNTAQGLVVCSKPKVEEGLDLTITVYPTGVYEIDTFTVNGVATTQNPYTVYNVHSDITIAVTFKVKQTPNPDQPTDPDPQTPDPQPGSNIPQAVDLGLSVYWASLNFGETNPWGNTCLYGWGDITGENHSTNYNTYAVGLDKNAESICGNPLYDITTSKLGNGWRLPTFAEILELYQSFIRVEQIENNGKIGIRYTNKNTGASILIPACGARYEEEIRLPSSYYYWTGLAHYDDVEGWKAYTARPMLNTVVLQLYPKFWGMAMRPVKDKNNSGNNSGNSSQQTQYDTYAVDLGLSDNTLWSDRNLGASNAADYGGYYAWAETSPRTINFDKEHYPYYNSATDTYQKTGTDVNSPNGDWLICGDENYDAAAHQWKGRWSMPTDDQIICLIDECNWQWKTNYNNSGHNGYLVTGPNGNSIFLPAAGKISGNELMFDGTEAYYWSGALNTLKEGYGYAFAINFTSDNQYYRVFTSRISGRSIRPVLNTTT